MSEKFGSILVVRTDRIGDVILTIPSLNALRSRYPNAHIAVMVAPQTQALIEGLPSIDEVIVDDRKNEHKGFGYFRLVRKLRNRHFDLAVIYHTKRRTNLACCLAGIPVRLGYKNNKFGFLMNRPVVDTRHYGEKHEVEYCLDLLRAIGIESGQWDIDVPVSESNVRWVEGFCMGQGISNDERMFVIHPGASDPSKCWSLKHFAQLIDDLEKKYDCRILIVGDSSAKTAAQQITSMTSNEVIDLTGLTSVGELAALVSRCSIMVSNDSGPVHIAAGVGTPVVSIFTRNLPGINPERWRPLGKLSKYVSVTRAQSQEYDFRKARSVDTRYSELIGVSEVLEAVDSLFKLC